MLQIIIFNIKGMVREIDEGMKAPWKVRELVFKNIMKREEISVVNEVQWWRIRKKMKKRE